MEPTPCARLGQREGKQVYPATREIKHNPIVSVTFGMTLILLREENYL